MSVNMNKLLEEIESDNELPNDYNDIPETPAYKIDRRFDAIKFPWINKFYNAKVKECVTIPILYSALNIETLNEKMQQLKEGEKLFLTKGVLKEQDIYCLKSIASNSCEATLLWLINFLMYKDMQSEYKYLKTCLVAKNYSTYNNQIASSRYKNRYNFEIVIL